MKRRMTRATFEAPVYRFRVRMLGGGYAPENCKEIWREIDVAANQPIATLGWAIPQAFDFDEEHMWSFFLSGKAWDGQSEYGMGDEDVVFAPPGRRPRESSKLDTPMREMPFPGAKGNKEFLYVFDFGDSWHFGVKLLRMLPEIDPTAAYPMLIASRGESPPQYPVWDDEEWDEESDSSSRMTPVSPAQ